MAALRIDSGAVVLSGDHLVAAREAVRITRLARSRNGLPEALALVELTALLAPCPTRDIAEEPARNTEVMTTRQAAEVLGITPRHVFNLINPSRMRDLIVGTATPSRSATSR